MIVCYLSNTSSVEDFLFLTLPLCSLFYLFCIFYFRAICHRQEPERFHWPWWFHFLLHCQFGSVIVLKFWHFTFKEKLTCTTGILQNITWWSHFFYSFCIPCTDVLANSWVSNCETLYSPSRFFLYLPFLKKIHRARFKKTFRRCNN